MDSVGWAEVQFCYKCALSTPRSSFGTGVAAELSFAVASFQSCVGRESVGRLKAAADFIRSERWQLGGWECIETTVPWLSRRLSSPFLLPFAPPLVFDSTGRVSRPGSRLSLRALLFHFALTLVYCLVRCKLWLLFVNFVGICLVLSTATSLPVLFSAMVGVYRSSKSLRLWSPSIMFLGISCPMWNSHKNPLKLKETFCIWWA